MSDRSFTLLVNPASGGGAAASTVIPVARALRDAGARVEVTTSPGPLAMAGLVAEAVARGDVVGSVGGDGMLSSLAGPVAEAGGTLAIVPAGRGNDFARMLGLPNEPAAIAQLLLTAEPRPVDLARVTLPGAEPRVVAGSMYAGVDAEAGAMVNRMRRVPSKLQYPLAAVRALAAYRPADVRLDVDGTAHSYRAACVVVANSGYYGKGMKIAPGAVVDDGLLEVVVIEAASKLSLMRSLPKVYDGGHVALPEVTVVRGRRIELTSTPAVELGGDGEPLGTSAQAVVEVLPGAVSVLA